MTANLTVQQADRDAAADLLAELARFAGSHSHVTELAFVRHRFEAEERVRQSAYAAGIEDAAMIVHEEIGNATVCYRVMRRIRALGSGV